MTRPTLICIVKPALKPSQVGDDPKLMDGGGKVSKLNGMVAGWIPSGDHLFTWCVISLSKRFRNHSSKGWSAYFMYFLKWEYF